MIFAISYDTVVIHKAWLNKANLSFPFILLADSSHVLAKNFKVLIEDKKIPYQNTFIINTCSKIVNNAILANYNFVRDNKKLVERVGFLKNTITIQST